MHRVSYRVNRIGVRASEMTDRVSGQVSERMGQVTERVHHATQRAVLPITVTCTVALSSGAAMGYAAETSPSTRPGAGSSGGVALATRSRERMVKPQRTARPQHRSARPRDQTQVRRARSERAPLADVRRLGKSTRSGAAPGQTIRHGVRSRRALRVRARFALWRLQSRARRGGEVPDSGDVERALAALDRLERAGAPNAYRRWRADMRRRKGFRTAAIVAAARGDFEAALKALRRARQAGLGVASRDALFGSSAEPGLAAALYDRVMRLADRFAERGRPDLVQESVDFAAEVAIENRLDRRAARHERRSARLLRASKEELIRELLLHARQSYRAGKRGEAWAALGQAREVKLAWSDELRELACRLERELGAEPGKDESDRKARRPAPVFRGARRPIRPGATSSPGVSQSRATSPSPRGGRSATAPVEQR